MNNLTWIILAVAAYFFYTRMTELQAQNSELKNDMGSVVRAFVSSQKAPPVRRSPQTQAAPPPQQQMKLRPYEASSSRQMQQIDRSGDPRGPPMMQRTVAPGTQNAPQQNVPNNLRAPPSREANLGLFNDESIKDLVGAENVKIG